MDSMIFKDNIDECYFRLRHITNGYWAVVQDFTHKATTKEVKRMASVTTNLGRGEGCTLTDCISTLSSWVDVAYVIYFPEATLKQKRVSCPPIGKTKGQSGGRHFFFFFFHFMFMLTGIYYMEIEKKRIFFKESITKTFYSALLRPVGRSTGNNFLFKGGLNALSRTRRWGRNIKKKQKKK